MEAAWFAAKGHRVRAVEPVKALRLQGEQLHRSKRIEWLDDRLPELEVATIASHAVRSGSPVGGVAAPAQKPSRRSLSNIARMLKPGALVIMSLRTGPGALNRPTFPVPAERTFALAAALGWRVIRQARADSLQQRNRDAGVTWEWLVFRFAPDLWNGGD